MNKTLSMTHVKQTRLCNRFLKNRTHVNKTTNLKQRNYQVSILRKIKRNYYGDINEKDIVDNKQFWKTIKPLFSNKK